MDTPRDHVAAWGGASCYATVTLRNVRETPPPPSDFCVHYGAPSACCPSLELPKSHLLGKRPRSPILT